MAAPTVGVSSIGTALGATTWTTASVTTAATGSRFLIFVPTSATAPSSVSDSKGNAYVQKIALQFDQQAVGGFQRVYECVNGIGGSGHTATVTFATSSNKSIVFVELLNVVGTDVQVSAVDTASPYTITSPSLISPAELAVLIGSSDGISNPATFAESTGFTILQSQQDNTSYNGFFVASKDLTGSTASITPSFTSTGSAAGASILMTFFPTLPSFTVQPTSQTTNSGSTATFTASASGTGGAVSYQWQDNRTGAFTSVASGGTSASYTTPATNATYQGRQYRVVATDSNGSTTSGTATLRVIGFPVYLWSTAVQSGNDVWLRDPLSQGAGGLTLALTGQAVTAAPGTVAAAVSLALSGQGVTVASDTITAATGAPVTVALSGQGLTAATGTLVSDRSIATSGTAVGVASGTLAPSASVAIAGTGVTVASGLIGPSVSLTLSGTAVGAATGLLTPSVNVTLNGQGLTGVSGALTASIGGNLTLALTGQDAFTAAGTLATGVSIALSGQAVTSAAGTLAVSVGPALSGQAATFATGLLTPALTLTLAGTPVVGGTGSLTALIPGDVTLALSGQDASFVAGNLIASSGNLATGGIRVGSLRGFERKTLTKAQIREQQIALGIIKDFPQQAAIEVVKGFIDPDISSADLEDVGSEIAEQSARMARLLGLVVEWQQIQDAIAMQVRIRRDEEQAILLVLTAYQAWQ